MGCSPAEGDTVDAVCGFFGGPAVSERPVALRTGLAAGVPLSE
jgi:hypothetical protein